MKFLFCVTTYNRLPYLQATLEGWERTRNPKHEWHLVVADDGSTDSTLEYLASRWAATVIHSQRRGVHHQKNLLLRHCEGLAFDVGFMADDDLLFLQPGWDDRYAQAIQKTGLDHLVHHDPSWMRVKRQRRTILHPSGLLACRSYWNDAQGAFWTFTPRVLQKVGYFDVAKFGLCGHGHRDYTYRACKAGLNVRRHIFDLLESNRYIALNKENYQSAPGREEWFARWNTPDQVRAKERAFRDGRIYVPYRELPTDLAGSLI